METVRVPETSVIAYQTTQHHVSEDVKATIVSNLTQMKKCRSQEFAENYSVEDHRTRLRVMCCVTKTVFTWTVSYDFTVVCS